MGVAIQCQGLTSGDLINMLKYYSCNLFIQEQGNIIHGPAHLFLYEDYLFLIYLDQRNSRSMSC